jgi:Uncharacterised protein family (UPF0014)
VTGQILAGLDPLEAVKYQILLMFLLSGGSGLSALAASYLAAWVSPTSASDFVWPGGTLSSHFAPGGRRSLSALRQAISYLTNLAEMAPDRRHCRQGEGDEKANQPNSAPAFCHAPMFGSVPV